MDFARRRSLVVMFGAALASVAFPVGGRAETDAPLLAVEVGGSGGAVKTFTRADLDALPQIEFATSTPWTEGVRTFSGPSFREVLAQAGVTQGQVKLVALNDYFVTMEIDETTADYPIIASRIDGAPFPVREKGPLWLLYPYDSDSELRSESVYSRSIWQLVKISTTAP